MCVCLCVLFCPLEYFSNAYSVAQTTDLTVIVYCDNDNKVKFNSVHFSSLQVKRKTTSRLVDKSVNYGKFGHVLNELLHIILGFDWVFLLFVLYFRGG